MFLFRRYRLTSEVLFELPVVVQSAKLKSSQTGNFGGETEREMDGEGKEREDEREKVEGDVDIIDVESNPS